MEDGKKNSFLEIKERVKHDYYKNGSSTSDQNSVRDWIVPIQKILGELRGSSLNRSIYKVPSKLRELNEDAYSPRVVSIGPFFQHKQQDLQAMEEHKWLHVLSLFHRTHGPVSSLDEIGKMIKEVEPKARGAYAETLKHITTEEFSEIMLIDSCFILEVFLRNFFKDMTDYTDPAFLNAWIGPTLRHDLALLENQVPFFLLEKLFESIKTMMIECVDSTIIDLALFFFHPKLNLRENPGPGRHHWSILHLTDLLHVLYEPKSPKLSVDQLVEVGKENKGFKTSATNLLEAGIEFKTGSTSGSKLMDIRFKKGVLKIPQLHIYETTSSLLKNLIAYEQCSVSGPHHVTSYAVVMKSLIRSTLDVELLERKNIVINDSGGDNEDVVALFHGLLKEVVLKEFYFAKVCENVNQYKMFWFGWKRCQTFWKVRGPRYYNELIKETFANPWKIIAFIAAVTLLLLTALQTFYSVRSYYPH